MDIKGIYEKLLAFYGPRGWWPLLDYTGPGNPAGYHPGDYTPPHTAVQAFEIILGAILTQNTGWKNVRTVLNTLRASNLLALGRLRQMPLAQLAGRIRSSGYFNQKAKKIKAMIRFLDSGFDLQPLKPPGRDRLLAVWGVGPETADSILLYAFKQPVFVVDAYTKRILSRLGMIEHTASYNEVQSVILTGLPVSVELYNELHALFVNLAKDYCRTKPLCSECPIKECKKRI